MQTLGNPSSGVNKDTIDAVYNAAKEAATAGLCFLPPAEDGTKRPLPNPQGVWQQYKEVRPTPDEMGRWFPGCSGLGIVTGAVSGDVECWDFDDLETYRAFLADAEACGLGPLVKRITDGYCDRTPGSGVRWLVRRPPAIGAEDRDRIILARRPKREEEKSHENDKIKILIELPRYAIVAPTNGRVHPTGKAYIRESGSFSTIASYTADAREALISLARSFDSMSRERAAARSKKSTSGGRPGDDYISRTTWEEILEPAGWTKLFTRGETSYWQRPGKKIGVSATTNYMGSDCLYVFTTSSPFESECAYDRFAAYAVLEHRGDFRAAAQSLAAKGFGQSGSPGASSNRAHASVLQEVGDYRVTEAGIEWCRQTKDGPIWSSLTNFQARIVSDITQDDGVETMRALEIEAVLNGRTHRFTVGAAQFGQMNWPLEHLGAEAVVQPGQGSKDRARAAIQVLSGRIHQRRVYTHTGWRQIDGRWSYLHSGGAVGPGGPVGDIEVALAEQLERYLLPDPGDGLGDAIDAVLAMRNVAPRRVTDPILGCIFRASIGGADFSGHLSGQTGAKKTELAALAQQHFGAGMDARALPASWSSTGNALEAVASVVKDALLVIDDFVPQGTVADRARLNALADRVLRAQGNRSGRGRLRSDATMRRVRPPRGLLLSTGEEVPGGQSLRARLVIIQVESDDVAVDQLTQAQHAAAQGLYAQAMAGFIMWLAPRLEQIQEDLTALVHDRRIEIADSHARTADAFAQISAAWTIWLRFAIDSGVVSRPEADAIEREVWASLSALAVEQRGLQAAYDPVDRFFTLLTAALSSGRAHISLATNPDRPPPDADDAKSLGWRRHDNGPLQPLGACIGWWAPDGLYLEADAAFAVAQQLGASSGEGVGVASTTLWRRMFERKVLLSTEKRGGEKRLKPRKTIGGRRKPVLHIAHLTTPYVSISGPTGPIGPEDENGQ